MGMASSRPSGKGSSMGATSTSSASKDVDFSHRVGAGVIGQCREKPLQRRHQVDPFTVHHDPKTEVEPVDAGAFREVEGDVAFRGRDAPRKVVINLDQPAVLAQRRHLFQHHVDPGFLVGVQQDEVLGVAMRGDETTMVIEAPKAQQLQALQGFRFGGLVRTTSIIFPSRMTRSRVTGRVRVTGP